MVSILLVHGRSRPLFGPAQMKEQWIVALRSGFEAAGLQVPFADSDVHLPWYGDSLTHLVGGDARSEAERVSLRGDMPVDEREFVRAVVAQVAETFAFTPAQLAEVADPGDAEAAPGQWGHVRTVLAAVDRYVPGMSGATVAFVARECFGYLTDARLRQTIDDGVANVARPGEPTVVLAHSLGAVIAYQVLRSSERMRDLDVRLFLTVGAPLAWRPVITHLGRLATPRMPAQVREWVNARDTSDAVALGPIIGGLLAAGAVTEEPGVVNPDDGRHAIEYYLADPVVARHIARTLG
ncbi:hypothetical protein [Serinibacter salmoneus]|uniref:Serine peptidase n=1 Tax=Serinibacter salmoneus TaxID=556530 RepID=A0A2A9CWU6_9MICO|nr:hypothetical protein [Serinibacter salmoneus]PFG18611.1 hypothetical protein ATL40_0152 [Serinibacter salmoneus]